MLSKIDFEQLGVLRTEDDPLCVKVSNLIDRLRLHRPTYNRVRILTDAYQDTMDYTVFVNSLFEDTEVAPVGQKMLGAESDHMSYVDFLCFIHKKIQDKFVF